MHEFCRKGGAEGSGRGSVMALKTLRYGFIPWRKSADRFSKIILIIHPYFLKFIIQQYFICETQKDREIQICLRMNRKLNSKISVPHAYILKLTNLKRFICFALRHPGETRGKYSKISSLYYSHILKFTIQQHFICND